jgi:hypothetical protein
VGNDDDDDQQGRRSTVKARHCDNGRFRRLTVQTPLLTMPSVAAFTVSILAMGRHPPARLPELSVRTSESPLAGKAMTQPGSPSSSGPSLARPASCQAYIPSTPGQQFRVQVLNGSPTDACVSLFVDGEWIYSGLSYGPKHKLIYFSGKLLDQSTVQEMHFMDADTTCTYLLFRRLANTCPLQTIQVTAPMQRMDSAALSSGSIG